MTRGGGVTRRDGWERARYLYRHHENGLRERVGLEAGEEGDQLDPAALRWLCGCGRSKPYLGSKAYPVCRPGCGRRMRILDHPDLGYARGEAPKPAAR